MHASTVYYIYINMVLYKSTFLLQLGNRFRLCTEFHMRATSPNGHQPLLFPCFGPSWGIGSPLRWSAVFGPKPLVPLLQSLHLTLSLVTFLPGSLSLLFPSSGSQERLMDGPCLWSRCHHSDQSNLGHRDLLPGARSSVYFTLSAEGATRSLLVLFACTYMVT